MGDARLGSLFKTVELQLRENENEFERKAGFNAKEYNQNELKIKKMEQEARLRDLENSILDDNNKKSELKDYMLGNKLKEKELERKTIEYKLKKLNVKQLELEVREAEAKKRLADLGIKK